MNDQERQALLNAGCWLCGRPFGKRVQWHHYVPKSRGGNKTVPVHPICHKTLHVCFSNAELEKMGSNAETLKSNADIEAFLKWIANKQPDFHAPTRKRRS